MMKLYTRQSLTTLFFCLSASVSYASDDCLIAFNDKEQQIGYQTQQGKVIIPAQYLLADEQLCNMAFVFDENKGFVAINRQNQVILTPYIYDNGPDYLQEGLFRFVENGKIGFANVDGKKIIPARYDFVTPFADGAAQYYIGGEPIYEDGRTRQQIIAEDGVEGLTDKHWTWGGNIIEKGYIDKQGNHFVSKPPRSE